MFAKEFGSQSLQSGESFRDFYNNSVVEGDEIHFQGSYDFSDIVSPITLNKRVTLRGIGLGTAIISGATNLDLFRVESDIDVIGIKFNNWEDVFNCRPTSKINFTLQRCSFGTCHDVVKADLGDGGFKKLIVDDSVFKNLTRRAINIDDPVDEAYIYRCTMSTMIGAGVRIYTNNPTQQDLIRNVTVENCHIQNVTSTITGNDVHGIQIGGQWCYIDGNYIENITNSGDGKNTEGIYTKVKEGSIMNNKCVNACGYDSEASITIKGAQRNSTSAKGFQISCQQNHIRMTDDWSDNGLRNVNGIEIQADSVAVIDNTFESLAKALTVFAGTIHNIAIQNNRIYNYRSSGIVCPGAGDNYDISFNKIQVDSNVTLDTNSFAIDLLNRDGNRTVISHNQIDINNPDGGGGGESGGILIKNADGSGWQIHHNQIKSLTGDTGADGYGLRILGGTLSSVYIQDNHFIQWGTTAKAFQTNLSDVALCSQQIHIGKNPGYDNQGITFPANDKTPSVGGSDGGFYLENYTGATITNFDNGQDGQEITLVGSSGSLGLVHGNNIKLASGANQTLALDTTKTFKRISGIWYEK